METLPHNTTKKGYRRHAESVKTKISLCLCPMFIIVLYFSRLMPSSTCSTLCKGCSSRPSMPSQQRTNSTSWSSTNWWPGRSFFSESTVAAAAAHSLMSRFHVKHIDMSQKEKHRCRWWNEWRSQVPAGFACLFTDALSWLPRTLNRPEPSLMLFVTPVLFPLWQFKMSAVKTSRGGYQASTYPSRPFEF